MSSISSVKYSALSHKGEIKYQLGSTLIRGLWGRICFKSHSGCWQNPVRRGYRPEVPISLQEVSQGPLSSLEGCLHSSSYGPSSFEPAMAQVLLMLYSSARSQRKLSPYLQVSYLGTFITSVKSLQSSTWSLTNYGKQPLGAIFSILPTISPNMSAISSIWLKKIISRTTLAVAQRNDGMEEMAEVGKPVMGNYNDSGERRQWPRPGGRYCEGGVRSGQMKRAERARTARR